LILLVYRDARAPKAPTRTGERVQPRWLDCGATFKSVGTSTLMSRWSESQAGGLLGALIRLVAPLLLSAQRTEMANLKRLIEARA
jgi:hypothetical protein